MSDTIAFSKASIEKGSKSFSLAAKLFDVSTFELASMLYSWCRYCDDQIDQAASDIERKERLKDLVYSTQKALEGFPQQNPAFAALQIVHQRSHLERKYIMDMLTGMEADASGRWYRSFPELLWYCYAVAGTVGANMAKIMGVTEPKALQHALDMGNAMQLTNIARDIREDFQMGRLYLPMDWLAEEGIPTESLLALEYQDKTMNLVKRLIVEAEKLYQSGDQGLKYLPYRSRCAVGVARQIYSRIGNRILKAGPKALQNRVYVPLWEKLWIASRTLLSITYQSWIGDKRL